MTNSHPSRGLNPPANGIFATTHWSVVLTAREDSAPGATAALEDLCQTYWYPLYAYIRRRGCSQHDAEDLTQGFLAQLLAHSFLAKVAPEKGKFRSFLLAALQNYLADQRDRASAQKRGGGQVLASLDLESAAERYESEPVDRLSPDKLFDRRWAMALLERARTRLKAEYIQAGKGELYEVLREFNTAGEVERTYGQTAARLGLANNTLKSLVHRLRRRYRQVVRDEIGQTVPSPAEVDEEIRYLMEAASS